MASMAATRSGKDLGAFFRFVLLGGILVVAVIVGLVAMHTLNLHSTPAAHSTVVVAVTATDAEAASHGAAGSHEPSGMIHDPPACGDCGTGDHLGMAVACVLALVLVLLVLVPPRLLPGWMHTLLRPSPVARFIDRMLSRAPSLHVLCISRT